jgi:catechol 2,3-dioxygenase-like lactoylglutathione lyase family enzyme
VKRFHVHLKVKSLEESIGFYSALFGKSPDKREPDYAKWMLEDPRANIAISTHGEAGVDHVGLQVDDDAELNELASRLQAVNADVAEENATTCCYAKSNKFWAMSPEGARWELFHTFADAATYSAPKEEPAAEDSITAACCGGVSKAAAEPARAAACCGA